MGSGIFRVWTGQARNEYLRDLHEEYPLAAKKQKTALLDEAGKRTGLMGKVLIRKLRHPATLVPKVRTQPPAPLRCPRAHRSSRALVLQRRGRRQAARHFAQDY